MQRSCPRWQSMGPGRMRCPRSAAAWSRPMWWRDECARGEQMPVVAAAARARSLQSTRPAWRLGATARRRVRELVLVVAAARARSVQRVVQQGLASVGRTAAEGEKKAAARGTWVAQAAVEQRMIQMDRVAVSERRHTDTSEGAAGQESEQEGRGRGNASTLGKGASARSAEGGASASTIG